MSMTVTTATEHPKTMTPEDRFECAMACLIGLKPKPREWYRMLNAIKGEDGHGAEMVVAG